MNTAAPSEPIPVLFHQSSTEDTAAENAATAPPEPIAIGEATANDEARWHIAEEVTDQLRRRYPADVLAVGAHGSLAHNDHREGSDIDLVAVTYRTNSGPMPTSRRINGWIVDVGVISADQYLSHARSLTTRWPLAADQYLHTTAIFDETDWHHQLRDAHLGRLAEAGSREFTALAREAWCMANSLYRRAIGCTEWFDTDGALLVLAEARIAAALTEGLLTRTYFRSSSDAARQTDLSGADTQQLAARLETQAQELAKRGRPVDGTVTDLFR